MGEGGEVGRREQEDERGKNKWVEFVGIKDGHKGEKTTYC